MQKQYHIPTIEICSLSPLAIICASGSDRVSSNIGLTGGDQSGDVSAAF